MMSTWLVEANPAPRECQAQRLLARYTEETQLEVASLGRSEVVFGGWLYDRAALHTELAAPSGTTDAALVLRSLSRWGEEAVARLRGCFAFLSWDGERRTLLGVRDHFGVFPLFYARAGGRWLFSPSVETLLAQPQVSRAPNRVALAAHLLDRGRDLHETFFEDVRRVPPGHLLALRQGSTEARVQRYWQPLPETFSWAREEELERFEGVLARAVSRPLELGRGGVYLSGGLDSGAVATLAAEHARGNRTEPPHAFSLLFADPKLDEASLQQSLAERLGLPQTCLPLPDARGASEVLIASLELNRTWPHPLVGSFVSAYLGIGKRAKRAGCAYVLTGDGGDEWLDVHAGLAADYLRTLDLTSLARLCAVDKALSRASWGESVRYVAWENGFHPLLLAGAAPAARTLRLLRRRRRRRFERATPPWLAPDPELKEALYVRLHKAESHACSFYQRELTHLLDSPLVTLQMEENFEAGRRVGLPILSPFFDPDLVSFLVRLPPHLRSLGGRSKAPLRRLLHRRFPEFAYDCQEKPFATDFFSSLVLGSGTQLRPLLRRGALAELGVVDADQLNRFVFGALAGNRSSAAEPLWAVLCSEVWVQSRLEGRVGQSLREEVRV